MNPLGGRDEDAHGKKADAALADTSTRTVDGESQHAPLERPIHQETASDVIVLTTPYDGDMSVTLYRPIGGTLTLIDGDSGAILGSTSSSFSYTVCGERQLRLRIAGKRGQRFRVAISAS